MANDTTSVVVTTSVVAAMANDTASVAASTSVVAAMVMRDLFAPYKLALLWFLLILLLLLQLM